MPMLLSKNRECLDKSDEAEKARQDMKNCTRRCGWYQYFATDVFASPSSILSSLSPYLFK